MRQECAHPAIVHFYTWLLQGALRGGRRGGAKRSPAAALRPAARGPRSVLPDTRQRPAALVPMPTRSAHTRGHRHLLTPALLTPALLTPAGYRTNAPFTNHAIVAFLRRISDPAQLNLEPMLYQARCAGRAGPAVTRCGPLRTLVLPGRARGHTLVGRSPRACQLSSPPPPPSPPLVPHPQLSVLRLFEAVLSDAAIKRDPAHADLVALAKGVTRRMFERYARQKWRGARRVHARPHSRPTVSALLRRRRPYLQHGAWPL